MTKSNYSFSLDHHVLYECNVFGVDFYYILMCYKSQVDYYINNDYRENLVMIFLPDKISLESNLCGICNELDSKLLVFNKLIYNSDPIYPDIKYYYLKNWRLV